MDNKPHKDSLVPAVVPKADNGNEDEDDLFSPLEVKTKTMSPMEAKAAPKKASLFSESSDSEYMFGTANMYSVGFNCRLQQSAEKVASSKAAPSNKSLFQSTDSSPDENLTGKM
jgi:hypothetical protein